MADYRLVYTRLNTGEVVGEFPVLSLGWSEAINSPGSVSASLLLEDTYAFEAADAAASSTVETVVSPQLVTLDTVVPGATGVYVERDGQIMFGGILWAAQLDVAGSTLNITAEGFLSYFDRLYISDTLTYSAVDQGALVKSIIDYAQAKPGAAALLTVPTPAVSRTRDRSYLAHDRKSVGEAISDLAAVVDGFDYCVTHGWNVSDDGIDSTFTIETNLLGRLTEYVFELGVNVSLLSMSLDGSGLANFTEAIGNAGENTILSGFAFDSPALNTYPLLETVEHFSDITVMDTLTGKAELALKRGLNPFRRVSLEVYADAVPKLGSYRVGDRVTVRGSYGMLELSGVYRIIELGVSVDASGLEVVSLSLVPQEVF